MTEIYCNISGKCSESKMLLTDWRGSMGEWHCPICNKYVFAVITKEDVREAEKREREK